MAWENRSNACGLSRFYRITWRQKDKARCASYLSTAPKAIVKRLHPSYVFFSENIHDLGDDIKVACYDYRGSALDMDIYNLTFFTDLPNGELFGWFSCPADLQEKWEPLVRQMIQTIKPLYKEEV